MRRPSALLFSLLLLSLSCLAGVASAEHVYSHRYVLWGRVLDAEGSPVPNVTVQASTSGLPSAGACAAMPGSETAAFPGADRAVTNALGEFQFCLHTHGIPAGARVRVVAQPSGASADAAADPQLRQSFLLVRLPEPAPEANATAREVPTILGRAWSPGPGTLEGIPVQGLTLNRVPVNVTLASADDPEVVTLSTTTNAFGDFAVRAPSAMAAGRGKVTVEIQGRNFNAELSESGATYVRAIVSNETEPPALATPPTPAATPPATTELGEGAVQEDAGAGASDNETPFAGAPLLALALVLGAFVRRTRRRG